MMLLKGGVSMKEHIKINGQLRKTNKKWAHLSQRHSECISNWLRKEYTKFVQVNHRKPKTYENDEILSEVMNRIEECQIWIYYKEVKKYYLSKIGKWFWKIENEWELQPSKDKEEEVNNTELIRCCL